MHVFPIIGSEVGAKEKVREKSKETEKEKEQEKENYGDLLSRLRANDTLPPPSPLPALIHSTSTASGRASVDLNIKSKRSSENTAEEEVAEREEAIVRLSGMIGPLTAPQSTLPPTLTTNKMTGAGSGSFASISTSTVTSSTPTSADAAAASTLISALRSSSISSSDSAVATATSPPLHPLDHPLRSYASTSTAPPDQPARAARNSPTPIPSNGLDADSVSLTNSVLDETAESTTQIDSSDVSSSFASSDLILSSIDAGTGTSSGAEVIEGRDVSRDISSAEAQGTEVEAVVVVEAVEVVDGQRSAKRKYSYSDEELDEEDNIDDIALAPSSALDKKKSGQASRDFPYHPAFQPVFSIVEKDKTEDFTPDSYYDQFKNEKQFFLKDQGGASDIDKDDADEEGMQRRSSEKRVETAAAYVRRVMGELRQEAVFREIDDSPRRGIMESIWEEIKDAEAVTVSSLSDWKKDKDDEEEDGGDDDVEVYDDDDDDDDDDDIDDD